MRNNDNAASGQGNTVRLENLGNNNGYQSNGSQPGLQARGRYSIPATAAPIICARGHDGRREWLSTAYEPERQPPALERLLALLDHYDQKYFASRRKSCAFPPPSVRRIEAELVAQRWRLAGTPAYLADRIARRRACALALRTRINGAVGDARSELQVSEEQGVLTKRRLLSTPARDDRATQRLVQVDSRAATVKAGAA